MNKKHKENLKNFNDEKLVNELIKSKQGLKTLIGFPTAVIIPLLAGAALMTINPILFPICSAIGLALGVGVCYVEGKKYKSLNNEVARRGIQAKVVETEMKIYSENKRIDIEKKNEKNELDKQKKIEKIGFNKTHDWKYSPEYKATIAKTMNETEESERQ